MPRPLGLLLAAVAALGLTWALVDPSWQVPDEVAHFGYVQGIGEKGALPDLEQGMAFSSEQVRATEAQRVRDVILREHGTLEWNPEAEARYEAARRGARDDGGHAAGASGNSARVNPPGYYVSATPAYLVGSRGSIFDSLFLVRMWGVALLMVAVAGSWCLVGELFGRQRLLQLAAGAVTGLLPMASFIASGATPDAMLIATWSVFLWLGARILCRGLNTGSACALAATAALAVLTKATGYALVPAALVVLAIGAGRLVGAHPARAARAALAGVAVLAVPVLAWIAYTRASDRPTVNVVTAAEAGAEAGPALDPGRIFDYLWQFYLPQIPGQENFAFAANFPLPVYDIWLKQLAGRFGWLQVPLPDPLPLIFSVVVVAIGVAGLAALLRRRPRGGWPALGLLALVTLATVAGLHYADYQQYVRGGELFMQGRYVLPLLPVFGVLAAAALTWLAPRRRAFVVGLGLAMLVGLQLVSLVRLAGFFYA